MTHSGYLANSAKLLLMCSSFLLAVNSLSLIGMYTDVFATLSSKLTTACFYIVLVLGFLAFNGEGITYKHSRQMKNKKKTVVLKAILLSAFLVRFIKTPVENLVLGINADCVGGAVSCFGLGVFNTVASYGFLMTVVALWYIFRDKGDKKLFIPQLLAFVSGVLYNAFKVFNYSVTRYGFTYFGEAFNKVFGNPVVLNALCLVHFACDIIMFVAVFKFYEAKAIPEQEEKAAHTMKMVTSRKIYSTDCFGLDTLEDDFLLEKKGEI